MKTQTQPAGPRAAESEAAPAKSRAVLRIAAGERRPKAIAKEEAAAEAQQSPNPRMNGPIRTMRRAAAVPKVEINPKLESSRGIISTNEPQKERPMSVAQKNRAAAEAAFLRVAPTAAGAAPSAQAPAAAASAAPPPQANGVTAQSSSNGPSPQQGPGQPHKSTFEMRISERDSITTTLRLTDSRETALGAARELAQKFKLPPDQGLLTKVIGLGDPGLTKLALEELLELDDRGRVRRTPELRDALDRLRSDDRETVELKDLLMEKIGNFGG